MFLFSRITFATALLSVLLTHQASPEPEAGPHRHGPWKGWVARLRLQSGEKVTECLDAHQPMISDLEDMEQQHVPSGWLLPFMAPDAWWGVEPLMAQGLSERGAHFEFFVGPGTMNWSFMSSI